MKTRVAWILASVLLAGCNRLDTPERLADRFTDLYFVETDQARARALTSGLAEKKIDDELRLVGEVRRTMTSDMQKPTVEWDRRNIETHGERARATYDLRIRQGGDDSRRVLQVGMQRMSGKWTISNFSVEELPPGGLPQRR